MINRKRCPKLGQFLGDRDDGAQIVQEGMQRLAKAGAIGEIHAVNGEEDWAEQLLARIRASTKPKASFRLVWS